MTEQELQKQIVHGLRHILPFGWLVQSTANKPRSAVSGAIEKSMGALAGWPDLTVVGPTDYSDPAVWFMECKTVKGRVSPVQQALHDRLADLGYECAIVRSWDEVLMCAKHWKWPVNVA